MKLSIFFLTLSSVAIVSCTAQDTPIIYAIEGKDAGTVNLPLAGSRGINMTVIDKRLSDIVAEASSIEYKMQELLTRLNSLKLELNSYDTVAIVKQPMPKVTWTNNIPELVKEQPVALTAEPIEAKISPAITKSETVKKPVVTDKLQGVNNVRYGVHKDKTRLVLDINGSTAHSMNFDKEVGIITLNLPKTKWSTATSKTYALSQISGYEAKSTKQGTIIAIAVKNASDVKALSLFNPSRIVLDILK